MPSAFTKSEDNLLDLLALYHHSDFKDTQIYYIDCDIRDGYPPTENKEKHSISWCQALPLQVHQPTILYARGGKLVHSIISPINLPSERVHSYMLRTCRRSQEDCLRVRRTQADIDYMSGGAMLHITYIKS